VRVISPSVTWPSGRTSLIFVALIALTCACVEPAIACSGLPPRSPEEIFRDSDYVFRGIAIKVEAIKIHEETEEFEGYPLVKVYWQVDEVFKGKNIKSYATVTNYICGGVMIFVGQPYVVSVDHQQDMDSQPESRDVAGILDDQGTFGVWTDKKQYENLNREFKKLSKRK
jgi:hypothetical protein